MGVMSTAWLFGRRFGWWVLALPLVGCGREPQCVDVELLALDVTHVRASGRTLGPGWAVGQLDASGVHTPLLELQIDASYDQHDFDHSPLDDRMWLLGWDYVDNAAMLYQFDASGAVEWSDPLDEHTAVRDGSVLHHEGALLVALTVETANSFPRLVVERRELDGTVVWTRSEILLPDEFDPMPFARGELIGVSGSAVVLSATPPLIDYGPSYPLTLDLETGDTIAIGEGHTNLEVAHDEERLQLSWVQSARKSLPDLEEVEPAQTNLRVTSPSGEALASSDTKWSKSWFRGAWYADDVELAWTGEQLVSLTEGDRKLGVTLHDVDGTRTCTSTLALDDIDVLTGWAIGLEGSDASVFGVGLGVGDPEDPYEEFESRVLLVRVAE
jgi:hypothetical protein